MAPIVRDDCITPATHDRLQRHFDGDIELPGDQRLHIRNHFPAIAFEAVGEVPVFAPDDQRKKPVRNPVDHPLEAGIADDNAILAESAFTESAVEAFLNLTEVGHHIFGRIRPVGGHDDRGIAPVYLQALSYSVTIAAGPRICLLDTSDAADDA